MKRALVVLLFLGLLTDFASNSLADEVTLKASGKGKWIILDSGGQKIGTLEREEQGDYSILPKGGQYLGVVKSNGDLQTLRRNVTITPSQARLYLDVLEAIKKLK